MKIRKSTHSGSWYNGNSKELFEEINKYFLKSKLNLKIKNLKSIIGPHAGYKFCGLTSSYGYKYLEKYGNNVKNIFLFGPSHFKGFYGCSLTNFDLIETIFGNIPVNLNIKNDLLKTNLFKNLDEKYELKEHSLEMHYPFIKKSLKHNFNIIPITVGEIDDKLANYYSKVFQNYFDDENNIFIFSSDFCHWGSNFDYYKYDKNDGEIYQSIEKLDKLGIDYIMNHKYKEFDQYLNKTENTICGRNPIKILLKLLENSKDNYKTELLSYNQSNKCINKSDSSVSYASIITFN